MDRRASLKIIASTGLGYSLLTSFRPLGLTAFESRSWSSFMESFSRIILGNYYSNPQGNLKKGAFIVCYIEQCWAKKSQETFWEASSNLQNYCVNSFSNPFENLTDSQQKNIISSLFDANISLFEEDVRWAGIARYLSLFEFFSGEQGATEVLRHLPLPGRYDGDIPLGPLDTLYRH